MRYIYSPSFHDQIDPKIIEGYEIMAGAEIEITKAKIDPCGYFRFIKDADGNRMSVSKQSIQRVS